MSFHEIKKNAFTLVELLVVIAILSIVILIASVSYITVAKNIQKKSCLNLKSYIEIGAEDYAEHSKKSSPFDITVEALVKEGYVTTDNNGTLTNTLDKTDLMSNTVTCQNSDGWRCEVNNMVCE